jgi:D-sedoheptulose 7-phosphate isomerase
MAGMTALDYLGDMSACLLTPQASGSQLDLLSLETAMSRFVGELRQIKHSGRQVHLIGNGGSAAVVAHAQNDLVKAAGIRAAVCQDVPLLTAFANDLGYEESFATTLSIWLRPGDLLIAVSSSGASPNILKAVCVALTRHVTVVTCSGFQENNPLRQLGELNFYVPSTNYGYVELTHAALWHYATDEAARA